MSGDDGVAFGGIRLILCEPLYGATVRVHCARHRWGYRAGRLCGTTVGATVRITVRGDRVRHHASKRLLSPMSRRLSHAAHKGVSARQGIRETFPSAACIHLSLITIPREKPVTTTHAPPASLCPRETFPSSPHAHLPPASAPARHSRHHPTHTSREPRPREIFPSPLRTRLLRSPTSARETSHHPTRTSRQPLSPRDIPVTAPHTPPAIPHLSERNRSPPRTHLPPASAPARHSRHCSAHASHGECSRETNTAPTNMNLSPIQPRRPRHRANRTETEA